MLLIIPPFIKQKLIYFTWIGFLKAELYLKHQYNNPQKAENLVEVDFVVKDKNFHKPINQEFDLVIANHVIEHIPNIISWFNNVSSLLKKDGFLFLSVPHKEYTFDKIRNLTSLSQIIRNYDEDLNVPTIYQVFEHLYFYRPISALDVWKGDFQELLNQKRFSTAFSFRISSFTSFLGRDMLMYIVIFLTFTLLRISATSCIRQNILI